MKIIYSFRMRKQRLCHIKNYKKKKFSLFDFFYKFQGNINQNIFKAKAILI